MELTNKTERSKLWNLIYSEVNKISSENVIGDAPDAVSIATNLENIFFTIYKEEMLSAYN